MSKISGDGVCVRRWGPGSFGWSRRLADGADVISLAGELDLVAAADLHLWLMSVVESSDAAVIILDLSDVRFIDAQCSGIIVSAWDAARRRGGRLEVVGLRGIPALVFDVLGLGPLLARRAATGDVRRDAGDRRGRARSVGGAHAAG